MGYLSCGNKDPSSSPMYKGNLGGGVSGDGLSTGLLPSATWLTPILLRESGQAPGLEGSSLRLTVHSPGSSWIPLEGNPNILPYGPGEQPLSVLVLSAVAGVLRS